MSKLDQNFKCPKELKVMLVGQPRSYRLSMYEAVQTQIDFKKRSMKIKSAADKAE